MNYFFFLIIGSHHEGLPQPKPANSEIHVVSTASKLHVFEKKLGDR